MGLSIGQSSATLTSASPRGPLALIRLRNGLSGTERSFSTVLNRSEAPSFFQSRETNSVARIGFGAGTISGPAAALNTLERTVDNARAALPTFDEIRLRFQLNRAEQRQEFQERQQRVEDAIQSVEPREAVSPLQTLEIQIPDGPTQARNFINAVNEVSSVLQERFSTEAEALEREPEPLTLRTDFFSFNNTRQTFQFDISV